MFLFICFIAAAAMGFAGGFYFRKLSAQSVHAELHRVNVILNDELVRLREYIKKLEGKRRK